MSQRDPTDIRNPTSYTDGSVKGDTLEEVSLPSPSTSWSERKSNRASIDVAPMLPEDLRDPLSGSRASVDYSEARFPGMTSSKAEAPQQFSLFSFQSPFLDTEVSRAGAMSVNARVKGIAVGYDLETERLALGFSNKDLSLGIRNDGLLGASVTRDQLKGEGSYDTKDGAFGAQISHESIGSISIEKELDRLELQTVLSQGPIRFAYGYSNDLQEYGMRFIDESIKGGSFVLGALFRRSETEQDQAAFSCSGPMGRFELHCNTEGRAEMGGRFQLAPLSRGPLSLTPQFGVDQNVPEGDMLLKYIRPKTSGGISADLQLRVSAKPKEAEAALRLNIRR